MSNETTIFRQGNETLLAANQTEGDLDLVDAVADEEDICHCSCDNFNGNQRDDTAADGDDVINLRFLCHANCK